MSGVANRAKRAALAVDFAPPVEAPLATVGATIALPIDHGAQ
jgi:hypothetical protein